MTKTGVLALTAGVTDIQIQLQDSSGVTGFYVVRDRTTADFHGWLLQNLEAVAFSEVPPTPGKRAEDVTFEAGRFYRKKDGKRTEVNDDLLPPQGMTILRCPKLMRIIAGVMDESWLVAGAIVYYTDRQNVDGARRRNEEPFAVGGVLQRWLSSRLGLAINNGNEYLPGQVMRVNYLQGKKRFEGRGRDYPVLRTIAARIEAPLRQAGYAHPDATLFVSTLGGIPPIKSLLPAAGGVYFPREVRSVIDTEDNEGELDIAIVDSAVTAERSYQVRKQCIRLVESGDFTGAWSAASELVRDASGDDTWAAMLRDLAFLFDGRWRPDARGSLAYPHALLLSPTLDYCPRTLLLSLRIDAALRRNSLADAMTLTAALPDAALLDGISRFMMIQSRIERGDEKRLTPLLEEEDVIDTCRRRVMLGGQSSPMLRKKILAILNDKMHNLPSGLQDGIPFWPLDFKWGPVHAANPARQKRPASAEAADERGVFDPCARAWLTLIDHPEHRHCDGIDYPELASALEPLCQRLFHKTSGQEPSAHDIGCRATGSLTDERALNEAKKRFLNCGLWQAGKGGQSCRLDPAAINGVIRALGLASADSLFEKIVAGAVSALRAHEMR